MKKLMVVVAALACAFAAVADGNSDKQNGTVFTFTLALAS